MRTILITLFCLLLIACDQAPTVEVAGESLQGKYVEDGKVAAFLGVPFAEPPVGELRWRAPQALSTKLEQREVVDFAPACMQSMRILDWYRYMAELFGGSGDYYDDLEVSEDCLYLNVWTPTLDTGAKLPVMVWVHGGSNKSGWPYEHNYHGHKLAQEGVVVISVAYRQGLFGFFSHPEMQLDEPVANFGYWDIIAALQWIQQNVTQFGGDADRVTLFGESAGAQNILALMFVEPAQQLFHRAILQSAAGYGLQTMSTLEAERTRVQEFANMIGIEANTLDGLRGLPADELLSRYEKAFSDYYHSPAVDGQLFSRRVWEDIQSDEFADIPLMIGTNDHEWYDTLAGRLSWDDARERAQELMHIDGNKGMAIVKSEQNPRRALDRLKAADEYLCKSQHVAARMTAAGGGAWMFHFTRVREDPAGAEIGAYHGAEYPYVFGTHDPYMTTTAVDLALEEHMQRYWVQFAATGNPNSTETPEWPQFTAPEFPVQELGDQVFTKAAPEPELCKLFEEWHTANYQPDENEASTK